MSRVQFKPLWWSVFILFFSIVYVLLEFSFNAGLVDVAGAGLVSQDQLKNIEFFGRFLSGIGVSLLLIDFFISEKHFQSKRKIFKFFAFVFFMVWPVIFIGQKFLVDQLVVENSSNFQRQQAILSNISRGAYSNGVIKIYDLKSIKGKKTTTEKTFLSVFGSLIYLNQDLSNKLRDNKEKIIENLVREEILKNFQNYYNALKETRESTESLYKDYKEASLSLNSKVSDVFNKRQEHSSEHWREMNSVIDKKWEEYSNASQEYKREVYESAEKIAPMLSDFFYKRNMCAEYSMRGTRNNCYEKSNERYKRGVKRFNFEQIPMEAWLIKENGQNYYDESISHHADVIRLYTEDDFKKKSGLPYGLTKKSFKKSPQITKEIKEKFKNKGVFLPKNWTPLNKEDFEKAIAEKIIKKAEQGWRSELNKKNGISLPPNLSWDEFKNSEPIKEAIYNKIPKKYNYLKLDLDWNNEQFYSNFITPLIKKETENYLDLVNSKKDEFKDGRRYEIESKKALRSIVVPPIAMGLSLILIIMSLIKIPFKIYEIYISKSKKELPKKYSYFYCSTIVIVFASFFLKDANVDKKSALPFLIDQVKKEANWFSGASLESVLSIQPLIYPVGNFIDSKTNLIKSFESTKPLFTRFDKILFGDNYKESEYAPLSINATPLNSTIKVMNIVPKYYDGMVLKKGEYDVKVSHENFETKRRSVYLDERREFHFNLKE